MLITLRSAKPGSWGFIGFFIAKLSYIFDKITGKKLGLTANIILTLCKQNDKI